MEEGDIATFFAQDVGLALVVKTCPHRPQAFENVNNGQAFRWENHFFFFFFFDAAGFQVPQGMPTKKKRANIR